MNTLNGTAASPNGIILAAGFGMRMVPINTMYTKGMLKVNGEPLVERLICQMQEAGIKDIHIVVGFMKEVYEYLIDKYDIKLIVNPEYHEKNNIYSLYLARDYLGDTFIVPCDVWCKENPFLDTDDASWYMVSDMVVDESVFRVNRKREISVIELQKAGNGMIGIAHLTKQDSSKLCQNLETLVQSGEHDSDFWEDALIFDAKFALPARVVSSADNVEINTYEQLRDLDEHSDQLKSNVLALIAQELHADQMEITNITVLKKGITNRSFLFICRGKRYIMRIPGEGTDKLINRRQEAAVYDAINGKGICDDIVFINPESGYKLTRFIENSRNCDAFDRTDLEKCMEKLREFHAMRLEVKHTFDIFGQIEYYENLWQHESSIYQDYAETKAHVLQLKPFLDAQPKDWILTHIDAIADNFLIAQNKKGEEEIRLIDWEYSGMQDPHVDIAMFCIMAMYDREHIDQLIDIYFQNQCPDEVRTKIYCYIAACGLLWSNWCEYKYDFGVEFGEYSLSQYRFAKDYYHIAMERIEKGGVDHA